VWKEFSCKAKLTSTKRNIHQEQMEIESESDSIYSENSAKTTLKIMIIPMEKMKMILKMVILLEMKNSFENSDCSNDESEVEYGDDKQEIRRLKIKSIMKILHIIKDV